MKIIYKSFFKDKVIFRQLLILLVLFVMLYLSKTFQNYIGNSIYLKNNTIDNRTITIVLKEGYQEKNLDISLVEKIEPLNEQTYKIVLKRYDFLEEFMKKNERIYANIEINQALNDKNNILIFFQKFLNITTVIINIFVFLMILINILEIFLNEKKEISLYKLLGFTNVSIIKYFGIILFIVYFFVVLLAALFYLLFVTIINFLFSLQLSFISLVFILKTFLIISFMILLFLLFFYQRLKKITPIYFRLHID